MKTYTSISQRAAGDGRILWMDAMRGFSIILVVLGHVLLNMGLGDDNTVLSSLLITFRMPLFFFVSGFFSYRSPEWWTRGRLRDILTRKFTAQILGAIIFFCIYEYMFTSHVNFTRGLEKYWFTVALFQMYLLYVAVTLVCRGLKCDFVMTIMGIVALALLIVELYLLRSSLLAKVLEWYKTCYYLQFYVLGLVASRYRRQFFALLSSRWFVTVVIIGTVVVLMLRRALCNGSLPQWVDLPVWKEGARYLGLSVVVMMFYGMADYWNRDTRLTRLMNYTGRRTLDIYYIHYFFLPKLLFMKRLLLPGNRFVIQLLVAGIITAMVVVMCLMVSAILRRSPLLRTFLFGLRPARK